MHETDLVSLSIHLSGWFDTGMTTYAIRLAQHHYAPAEPVSKRLSPAVELRDMRGEAFLSDRVQQDLTRWILKSVDQYAGAMLLP
jgi:hypothetical protein